MAMATAMATFYRGPAACCKIYYSLEQQGAQNRIIVAGNDKG